MSRLAEVLRGNQLRRLQPWSWIGRVPSHALSLPIAYARQLPERLAQGFNHARLRARLRMQHVQYASVPTVRGPLPDLVVEGRLTFGTGCRFRSFRTKTVLTVYPGAHLEIGDNVGMNDGVNICATKRIVIGAYTRIADMVFIYDTYFHDVSPDRTLEAKDVIIGRNVWIGARATILPGVRIGDHSVVGAGAVVTKDIPPKAIAVGSPATVVRTFECPDDWIRK